MRITASRIPPPHLGRGTPDKTLKTIGWWTRQTPSHVGRRRRQPNTTELFVCGRITDVSIAGGPAETVSAFFRVRRCATPRPGQDENRRVSDSLRFSTPRHGLKEDADPAMSGFQGENRVKHDGSPWCGPPILSGFVNFTRTHKRFGTKRTKEKLLVIPQIQITIFD